VFGDITGNPGRAMRAVSCNGTIMASPVMARAAPPARGESAGEERQSVTTTGDQARPPRRAKRALHVALAAVLLLTACAADESGGAGVPGTREGQGRIGPDDGRDPCRQELVDFDASGVFFTTSIIAAAGGLAAGIMGRRPGIIGGIAAMSIAVATASVGYLAQRRRDARSEEELNQTVASDLDRENQGLDRTQQAFDRLAECRARQAQQVRQQQREGAITAETARERLGVIRSYAEQDIRVSQSIQRDIDRRGGDFDSAMQELAPDVRQAAAAAPPRPAVPARAQRSVALRLRPQPSSTAVAELPASQPVQLRPAPIEGIVRVETPQGQPLGYAPAADFAVAGGPAQMRALAVPAVAVPPPPAGASPAVQQVRFLAATNLAKRDNFRDSIREVETVLVRGGFEAGT